MNDIRYNTRSSEWIGDMTVWLRDNAGDNRDQLLQLRRMHKYIEIRLTARETKANLLESSTMQRLLQAKES